MLTITTIISYGATGSSKGTGLDRPSSDRMLSRPAECLTKVEKKRAKRRALHALDLCMQCSGPKPCQRCYGPRSRRKR